MIVACLSIFITTSILKSQNLFIREIIGIILKPGSDLKKVYQNK